MLAKVYFFCFKTNYLVMGLAWALTMVSEQEKLFAPQENLLVLDVLNVRTFFGTPVIVLKVIV